MRKALRELRLGGIAVALGFFLSIAALIGYSIADTFYAVYPSWQIDITTAGINYFSGTLLQLGALSGTGTGTGAPAHISTAQATAPALTSCGSGSPTITGTDTAGVVTEGTTATGCTITFNVAYAAVPFCVVSSQTAPATSTPAYTVSASAITITNASTSGEIYNYICIGRSGG